MTFQKDLLTVIVPTKERPDTLKHCLRTLVEQKDPRLQIIVSDNVSGPETKAVFDSFSSDKRLKYIRPESRLGMSEHYDFALSHADGEWVTIIGDDDGLLPDAVSDFFELIKGRDVKAVNTCQCKFYWPNEEQGRSSKLTIMTGSGVEIRETKPWLMRVLRGNEKFIALPYIYTGGFVHADVIDEIRKKSGGRFFSSMNPDIYSGVAVALTIDHYLYSWKPLAIAGISKHSIGAAASTAAWVKEDIKNLPFYTESAIGYHPALGNGVVYTIPMDVYESFLRAAPLRKDDMGITMEDQLALSIVHAAEDRKDDVYALCKTLAKQNGVDFAKVEQQLTLLKIQTRVTRTAKNIIRGIFRTGEGKRQVVKDPAIRNVYDAAEKIREIFKARKKAA